MDLLIIWVVLFVIVIVIVLKMVKIVLQQYVWVFECFGCYYVMLLFGFNIVLLFVDCIVYWYVLKEILFDVLSQVCIMCDNMQLQVDGVLYFQVIDLMKVLYGLSNFVLVIMQFV